MKVAMPERRAAGVELMKVREENSQERGISCPRLSDKYVKPALSWVASQTGGCGCPFQCSGTLGRRSVRASARMPEGRDQTPES